MAWSTTSGICLDDSIVADATESIYYIFRGLKPTATVTLPLRGRREEESGRYRSEFWHFDRLSNVKYPYQTRRKYGTQNG